MKEHIRLVPESETTKHKQIEPLGTIFKQSHKIGNIEAIFDRKHLARPYPETNYDFLAINVPSTYQQGMIPDGEEPPWGMLRVVASAREVFEFNAGILDAHRLKLSPDAIREQIVKIQPKLVGLNPTSVNVPEGIIIVDILDAENIPYILGGIHATLDPKIARRDFPQATAIVRGNGELAIEEVINTVLNNHERSNNRGIYYKGHELNGRFDYTKKLNPGLIPIVKQDVYIEQPLYKHEVSIHGKLTEINEVTLFVTDGCPFECTYCSSPIMVNRGRDIPYARPEMTRILDEIEHVVNIGGNAIHFLDDMAFIKGDNIRELHAGLAKRGLMSKFIWRGLTRAPVIIKEDFGNDVMEMMKQTGAWKIAFGVESGNDEMLKKIKKKITTEQVIQAVNKLASNDIQVKGFFIMGFPEETEKQLRDTKNFIMHLKDLGLTEISVFQFKPYPGTTEYSRLMREKPEILEKLNYLRHTREDLTGEAQNRAENHVWLPDDLMIAEVNSGRVREYVVDALQSFYGQPIDVYGEKDPSCI